MTRFEDQKKRDFEDPLNVWLGQVALLPSIRISEEKLGEAGG